MKNRSLTLMQLHDGELDPADVAEFEASLSEADISVMEGVAQLGDVLRTHADARAASADSIADDLFAQIDAEDQRNARLASLRVIEGGAGADEPAHEEKAAQPSQERPSAPASQASDGRAGRLFLALSLAAAVALCAQAVITANYAAPEESVARLVENAAVLPAVDAEFGGAEAELSAAAIESVDFGSQNGAIFMVSAGAETTPVVWLSDDPQSGDRMEPL